MQRPLMALPLMLLLIALAGCGGRAGDAGTPTPSAEQVRVTIQNDAFYQATVYLLRGAERRRLGTVNAASTTAFTLPRHLVHGLTDLRFVVDWIGRRAQVSETILAEPGDEIRLRIR